jgi:flagellar biosynthesis protein FlhF
MTTKTYRGSTIEELRTQVVEELGENAVITRRREGYTGGIGGFFGKRCIEIDAQPGGPSFLDLLDTAYDESDFTVLTGEETMEIAPEPEVVSDATVSDTVEVPVVVEVPTIVEEVPPSIALAGAGLPLSVTESVIVEVKEAERVYGHGADDHRSALARRIATLPTNLARGGRIALIGPSGSGRTTAVAAMCTTAAAAGVRTGAIALGSAKEAITLGTLLQDTDVEFEIAVVADEIVFPLTRLSQCGLVVVDSPTDPHQLAQMLDVFAPEETHLVLPATMSSDDAIAQYQWYSNHVAINRVLVTHTDDSRPGGAVGLSLATGCPLSFLSDGGRLRPASPIGVAEALVP